MSRRSPAFTPAVKERIQYLHQKEKIRIVDLAKRFGCRANLISEIVNVPRGTDRHGYSVNQNNKMTEGA